MHLNDPYYRKIKNTALEFKFTMKMSQKFIMTAVCVATITF